MKKTKIIAAILVVAQMGIHMTVTSTAAGDITLDRCDAVSRIVTVSGMIETNRPNKEVILTVLKANTDAGILNNINLNELDTVMSYFSQKPLEADGSFSFVFKMKGESGDYAVLIDSDALGSTYTHTLSFTNTVLDEFKAVKDDTSDGALQRFKTFIEAEGSYLGIDMEEYNTLPEDKKTSLCTSLKSYTGDYTETTFASVWEENVVWLFVDSNKSNPDEVLDMIKRKNSGDNGLFSQNKVIEFFLNNFCDEDKSTMLSDIINDAQCVSTQKLVQMLAERVLVDFVHNSGYFRDLYTVVELENNPFGFTQSSIDVFNTLNDKDAVVSALYTQGQGLITSTEIISLFDTLVSAQKTAENAPAPTPTQKPRPNGGGGSWSVGTPVVVPSVTPTPSVSLEPAKPAEPSKSGFNDIESVEWAHEAIEYLAEKGILSGVGDGKFEPNRPMTREELVKMLDNAFGYSKEKAESNFADADKNAWYYNAISAAAQKGIINGYADNTFGIGKQITREDAAVIFLRAVGSERLGSFSEPEFSDNSHISDYAKEAVGVMNKCGIISGMGNGMFMPKKNLTRAEAAKMFYGLLMCIEDEQRGV